MSAESVELTPATLAANFAVVTENMAAEAKDWTTAVYAAWLAGNLTTVEFAAVVADYLTVHVGAGLVTADIMAAVLTGEPATGMMPDDATVEQLRKAAQTLADDLDGPDPVAPRLERLAVSETVNAAQQGLVKAYESHGITGWRRATDADPCELCVWLVKAHLDPEGIGYIYPVTQSFHRHPGCCCTPVPATRKTITN